MEDMKKALYDNNIDFNQLQDWNADSCLDLMVEWWTRDEYQIDSLLDGTQCAVFDLMDVFVNVGVLFFSKINWYKNNYYDQQIRVIF
jgi:hypothetical protein